MNADERGFFKERILYINRRCMPIWTQMNADKRGFFKEQILYINRRCTPMNADKPIRDRKTSLDADERRFFKEQIPLSTADARR